MNQLGTTLKSTIGEAAIVAELLDPKTELVFLEEIGDGEFLGVGLGNFDLVDVGAEL